MSEEPRLEQADISGYLAQSAQRIPVVVISTLVLLIAVMTFYFVQQELAAQNCCRAPHCSHCHITAAALQKAAQAALLTLCWYVRRGRDDTCEAGMTAGAISGSHRCHSHTDRAAQHHGLLSQHRLLIAHLSILWLAVGLLLWILRLTIWLLAILRLAVLLRLLRIGSLRRVCRIRRLTGLSLRCRQ